MTATFQPAQQVIVHPDSFDYSPAWIGTIVKPWRNGTWIVREPAHGTTCAYDEKRLTAQPLTHWCEACCAKVEVHERTINSQWWHSTPVCAVGHVLDLEVVPER
jgi:hypothetical protein